MKKLFSFILICVLLVSSTAVPVAADENEIVFLTAAFLGGSITEGTGSTAVDEYTNAHLTGSFQKFNPSWVNLTGEYLKQNYGAQNIINAGIGGTTSGFGMSRVGKDVIFKIEDNIPDIVFVEFTVNDGTQQFRVSTWESIVRQLYAANPNVKIVFVNTVTSNVQSCVDNSAPQKALAEYYNIPVIDMANQFKEGDGYISQADMKSRYTPDSTHPNNAGYEKYFDEVVDCFQNADWRTKLLNPSFTSNGSLKAVYNDDKFEFLNPNYDEAETSARLEKSGAWQTKEVNDTKRGIKNAIVSTAKGDRLEYEFYGSGIVVTMSRCAVGGIAKWDIDYGEKTGYIDLHSTSDWWGAPLTVTGLATGKHVLRITNYERVNSKCTAPENPEIRVAQFITDDTSTSAVTYPTEASSSLDSETTLPQDADLKPVFELDLTNAAQKSGESITGLADKTENAESISPVYKDNTGNKNVYLKTYELNGKSTKYLSMGTYGSNDYPSDYAYEANMGDNSAEAPAIKVKSAKVNGNKAYTVEAWAKANQTNVVESALFGRQGNYNTGSGMYMKLGNSNNKDAFNFTYNNKSKVANGNKFLTDTGVNREDQWAHYLITASYDETAKKWTYNFYLNGNLCGYENTITTDVVDFADEGNWCLYIGRGAKSSFAGDIGTFKFYDRVLNMTEIGQAYAAERTGFDASVAVDGTLSYAVSEKIKDNMYKAEILEGAVLDPNIGGITVDVSNLVGAAGLMASSVTANSFKIVETDGTAAKGRVYAKADGNKIYLSFGALEANKAYNLVLNAGGVKTSTGLPCIQKSFAFVTSNSLLANEDFDEWTSLESADETIAFVSNGVEGDKSAFTLQTEGNDKFLRMQPTEQNKNSMLSAVFDRNMKFITGNSVLVSQTSVRGAGKTTKNVLSNLQHSGGTYSYTGWFLNSDSSLTANDGVRTHELTKEQSSFTTNDGMKNDNGFTPVETISFREPKGDFYVLKLNSIINPYIDRYSVAQEGDYYRRNYINGLRFAQTYITGSDNAVIAYTDITCVKAYTRIKPEILSKDYGTGSLTLALNDDLAQADVGNIILVEEGTWNKIDCERTFDSTSRELVLTSADIKRGSSYKVVFDGIKTADDGVKQGLEMPFYERICVPGGSVGLRISNVKFISGNEEITSNNNIGSTIKATFEVSNNTDTNKSFVGVLALYNNNALVAAKTVNVTDVAPKTSGRGFSTRDISVPADENASYTVKFMAWSDLNSLMPITKVSEPGDCL